MKYRGFFAVCVAFLPHIASAQWIQNGVPLCTSSGDQFTPLMCSDGAGGAIVAWSDTRNANGDVFAQRVSGVGEVLWTAGGVPVCTAAGYQSEPNMIPDGSHGAFLVWYDQRNGDYDIYAQHLDGSGDPLWTSNGVPLDTLAENQMKNFRGPIVSDGAGGVIVTWWDNGTSAHRVHAQRLNDLGVAQWADNGIEVSPSATGAQNFPVILEDGAGGAFIVWNDSRNGGEFDIYAQRLNALGQPQWSTGPDNFIAVCTATDLQRFPVIAADGFGGFVVAWEDWRDPGQSLAYIQRVNSAGAVQWSADGVPVGNVNHSQTNITMDGDAAGGWLVAWADDAPPFDGDLEIFAQRLGTAGQPVWTAGGVGVCTNVERQEQPKIVPDGSGGAYLSWLDQRNGSELDVYSQRLDPNGQRYWDLDGVPTCDEIGDQAVNSLLATGDGGAIAAWSDDRGGNNDIYAGLVTDTPNAVAITSFQATARNGVVVLQSSFRSDFGAQAVNIYRATGGGALLPLEHVPATGGDTFAYQDARVTPGQTYRYQIGVEDPDGEFFSPIAIVTVDAIALHLDQNHPNPFNPTTTIHFVLPTRERATLTIYDTSGHKVRTLLDQVDDLGAHDVAWDGRDDTGASVGSGVYFYRLTAGKRTETKKMTLLK
jgi:hypothetical protein